MIALIDQICVTIENAGAIQILINNNNNLRAYNPVHVHERVCLHFGLHASIDILVSVYEYVSAKLCIRYVGMQCKQWRVVLLAPGNIMAWCAVGFMPETKGGGGTYLAEKRICPPPPPHSRYANECEVSLTAKCQ